MENNQQDNHQTNEQKEQKNIETDKNNLEQNNENQNLLKISDLNNTEKDLKNGISQDIPNIYTPMQSNNLTEKEKEKLNNNKENEKPEKIEEVNEIKDVDENNKDNKNKEKEKDEQNNDKENMGKIEENQLEQLNQLDKEKSEEIKMIQKNEENKDDKNEQKEKKEKKDNSLLIEDEDNIIQTSERKKEEKNVSEKEKEKKEEQMNNIKNAQNYNLQTPNVTQVQNQKINEENNVNDYNYVYDQETNALIPIITIKDLQNNPKEKLLINSPYSLKALYDSGYTMDELHYRTLDEFVKEHKEVIHISEEAKMNRYNFYEQLRLDKISHLVDYREKIIKEDQEKDKKKSGGKLKPMKNIIIDNHIRIAKEEIDVIQKKHEKELANIIELELDKDLFNLEMIKQEENYNKEYEKLNFLNLNSNDEENENENEDINPQQEQEINNRYNVVNNSINSQNIRSSSSRRKNHLVLNEHNTYLDNLYSLQQAKVNQKYAKNQKKNAKKLERVEKVNKIKGEQMALKKRIEVERATQNLLKNAMDFQNRHENLIKEIQMKKLLIYQNKKKFDNYLQEKKEWNYLKYMVKLDYIASLKRKDENERQLKYEKLLEKQSKRDRIKLDRMDVFDSKKLKLYYLNSERKRNIIKIKNILDTGIDEENLHKILMAFPGNKEIDKVIENYKNQKELIQNGEIFKKNYDFKQRPKSQGKLMIKSFNKTKKKLRIDTNMSYKKNADLKIPNVLTTNKDINKKKEDKKNNREISIEDNKILYESEIREKIRQYKENIYREFFRHVEDEKHNEDLRNKQLEGVHDPQKRHELEKRFSKERALVDLRLKRENKNIEEKIRSFEIKLRQANFNNQNLFLKGVEKK